MSEPTLEERVAALENEVARLRKRLLAEPQATPVPWWELHFGAFKDDPMFDEAMRLGAEYRRSLVPPEPGNGDDVSA